MMIRIKPFALLVTMLVLSVLPGVSQTIPPIKAKALDDTEVILPKSGSPQFFVLVLGFSHKSAENCAPWGKRLAADYHSEVRVSYYQVPVLQDAPSFVRGFIVRGMRKDMPAAEQSHFVPLYDHEADWKKLVGFSAPDDAYLVLADPDGHVLWQSHGPISDTAYADLKSALAKFLPAAPSSSLLRGQPGLPRKSSS
jgi:hypothetical protein